MDSPEHDVIVVGAGNAALCGALSAREHGARVVVLECAPEAEAGGNSRFAGGVMRFAFDGVDDLRKVADLADEEVAGADFGTYTRAQYFDDLFRLTRYRCLEAGRSERRRLGRRSTPAAAPTGCCTLRSPRSACRPLLVCRGPPAHWGLSSQRCPL